MQNFLVFLGRNYNKFLIAVLFLGIAIIFYFQRLDIAIRGLLLFVPLILAIIFFFSRKEGQLKTPSTIEAGNPKIWLCFFFILFSISLIVLNSAYYRNLVYFLLMASMAALIYLQIFSKQSEKLILLQVFLWMISLTWSMTLKYPLFYSGTDILGHMDMTEAIVNGGHVQNITPSYYHFPLYHILNATIVETTGLSIKSSILGLMPGIFIGSFLFLYIFLKRVLKDSRIVLLSLLLFASNGITVWYAQNSITRTLAFTLFLLWLILMSKKRLLFSLPFIIVIIATIIMHQASMLLFVTFLLLVYLATKLLRKGRSAREQSVFKVQLSQIVMISSMFVFYWIYVATDFLEIFVETFTRPELITPAMRTNIGHMEAAYNFLYSNAFYAPSFFLILLGLGAIWKNFRQTNKDILTFSLVAILCLPIYIKGPTYLLHQTRYVFQLDRLTFILTIIMVLPMTYGIIDLLNSMNWRKVGLSIATFILFLYVFLGISNPQVATDFNKNIFHHFFSSKEVQSLLFIEQRGKSQLVHSDYHVKRYFKFGEKDIGRKLDLSSKNFPSNGLILLRMDELRRRGLPGEKGSYSVTYNYKEVKERRTILNTSSQYAKIYSNKGVEIWEVD